MLHSIRPGFLFAVMVAMLCAASPLHAAGPATQSVHPRPVGGRLHNPWMGFIYYGGRDVPDIADVVYLFTTWGDMEPAEGNYVWDAAPLGYLMTQAKSHHLRMCMRVVTSWQDKPYATPKWVHDLGVPRYDISDRFGEFPGFKTFHEPQWWNPIYIEKYCRFIEALGKHFDGMEDLDFVDVRCYGMWGEGHRWQAREPWPDNVSKRQLIIRFTDAHLAAFKQTPLALQMSRDKNTPYPQGTAIDYGLKQGLWMRRDGFGAYLNKAESDVMAANWKTSLMIGENGRALTEHVAGKVHQQKNGVDTVIGLDELFDEMLQMHCNYMSLGFGDGDWTVLKPQQELLEKIATKIGYRIEIPQATFPTSVAAGAEITISTTWVNRGAGRLPFAYPLAVYLIDDHAGATEVFRDSKFDQTAWYRDEEHTFNHTFKLPADLKAGSYTLLVALIDGKSARPAIALGIEGDDGQRRYRLGSLAVETAGK